MRNSDVSEEDDGVSGSSVPGMARSIPDSATDDALFEHNIEQINIMSVPAGSMVKGLIMELERGGRDTYIRLRDATPNGHAVSYDLVRGDLELVGRVGRALGFAKVTEDRLEVRHV